MCVCIKVVLIDPVILGLNRYFPNDLCVERLKTKYAFINLVFQLFGISELCYFFCSKLLCTPKRSFRLLIESYDPFPPLQQHHCTFPRKTQINQKKVNSKGGCKMVVIEKYTLCVRKIGLFMTRHSLEINSHLTNILCVGGNRVTISIKGGNSMKSFFRWKLIIVLLD